MKVLQINSVCGIGSTGRIATDIHGILKALGNESYIAYGREPHINCDSAIKIGSKFDNYTHIAKTRSLDMHGFGSKSATKIFINKVKVLDPDVIHLHNIHGYYLNVELLFDYLKVANKPVVWTLHDCWPFTGHCSYFDYSGCECWKIDGDHRCIQKQSYPASLLLNNSKKNYSRKRKAFTGVQNLTIVTPSKWLANLVKQSFLGEYAVKVINNGIDMEVFKPTENKFRDKFGLTNKFIILGVASVWDRRKGLKYFTELSKQLNNDEAIVLVGLSNKQIKELPKNIIGITRTNSIQELAEIYTSADVFVNPTLEDNFPTTNLEALACETPVITFNTGGSIESVDADTGIIVNNKTTDDLITAINIIKDRDKSSFCFKDAREKFEKNNCFQKYIDLYSRVVD